MYNLTRRKLILLSSYMLGAASTLIGSRTFKISFVYKSNNEERPDISSKSGRNQKKGDALDKKYLADGRLIKINKKVTRDKLEYTYVFKDLRSYFSWEQDVVSNKIFNRSEVGKHLSFSDKIRV